MKNPTIFLISLIVLLPFVTGAATFARIKDFQRERISCMRELNLTRSNVRSNATNAQCLDRCILTRQELMNDNGDIDIDAIPTPLQEQATNCDRESADMEQCPRARFFIRCLIRSFVTNLRNVSRDCANRHNVSMGGGLRRNIQEIISNPDMACYERCVVQGLGIMDENDNFVVGNMQLSPELGVSLQDLMDQCTEENNQDDVCIKAVSRNMCLNRKIREGATVKPTPSEVEDIK